MQRITGILKNNNYQSYLKRIEEWEKNRVFCKHDKKHFLDVARIAYILYLEELHGKTYNPYTCEEAKELLYAAALLHDIGRWREYEEGIEHHIASAELSEEILINTGFKEKEIKEILTIILSHRVEPENLKQDLPAIFYRADKQSRECFWCEAEDKCNWKKEKKNYIIQE